MNEDMAVFVILVSVLTLLALVVMFIVWKVYSVGPKMKYKNFRKFYALNPDRWDLDDCSVYCRIKDGKENFNFGFIDFWRYKLWIHGINKRERNADYAKCTQRMMDAVREDIKSAKAKSDNQISNAIRTIIEAMRRLKVPANSSLEELLRKVEELEHPVEGEVRWIKYD